MGRVYDALKRAGAAGRESGAGEKREDQKRRNGAGRNLSAVPPEQNGNEHLLENLALFSNTAQSSASTAHTETRAGSALPGVMASREAGATLGAAGTTRALPEFMSIDISAARVEPHLVAVTQPRSAYCENFRALRTRVLQAGERKKMQAFVITSAGVAEGKTLTALNLAWLLAQTDGVSALIIDSDLRQPCATHYLGIDAPLGLSEVLAGEATLEETIIKLEPAGLHLLPGGEARDDVAELLSGPRFGQILSELRRMFDYILIDAPPMGIFTDANVLINRADGALLVVRSGKTRYSALDRLVEQLPRERLLGVVLNRTDEEVDESSYYYQRRYYKGRDKSALPPKNEIELRKGEEVVVGS